jgi:hypothetical protein
VLFRIFNVNVVYFVGFCIFGIFFQNILFSYGIFCGLLVYLGIFHRFWLVVSRQSGSPCCYSASNDVSIATGTTRRSRDSADVDE